MWLCCAFLEGLMAERDETWVWWLQQLAEYRQDGRDDAERGEFSWPYPFNEEGDKEFNIAYKTGFDERRKELGVKFAWR